MSRIDKELCYSCKFFLWFNVEQRYRCDIKGCWKNSKYIEYTTEGYIKEIRGERRYNR